MSRFSVFRSIAALAAALFSGSTMTSASMLHLGNSLTPNQSPPKNGKGNASAVRIALKLRQKKKAKQVARRKR